MQSFIFYIQDFLPRALNLNNDEIKITEPFKGLFTQGMVCHETYKDKNNNWLSPDEVISDDKKNYFKKNILKVSSQLDHLSQCLSQKKILLTLKK